MKKSELKFLIKEVIQEIELNADYSVNSDGQLRNVIRRSYKPFPKAKFSSPNKELFQKYLNAAQAWAAQNLADSKDGALVSKQGKLHTRIKPNANDFDIDNNKTVSGDLVLRFDDEYENFDEFLSDYDQEQISQHEYIWISPRHIAKYVMGEVADRIVIPGETE